MYDYTLLEALAAVVREGSFERAARALHLTPSAVSQRVRLLEERAGQVLVVRDTPTRATEAGARLCRHQEQVALLERALAAELPGAGPSGGQRVTLPIAVNADSLATWFVPAAARIADGLDLLLDISLEDQDHTAERLRRGEVVAAVTALDKPVPGCRSVPLGTLDYRATASPAFCARWFAAGVDAATLAQAPSLTFSRRDRLQTAWVAQWLGTAEAPALPTHWLPSTQAFVDASLAGLGWGMNPEPLVREALAQGCLQELVPGRPLGVPLYWQCRQGLPVAAALTREVLAAAAAVLPASAAPSR
ncbi:LysR family transcriptional regulator ArgP [Ideonella sp. B7]|uniref:LysR family transcriptional regulator ArgP n=1 Tax=Ideonella benzenivorans TaxID=2831643 RepID=UPI001CEC22F7|nr:LysR family transcriptional regulator ArgP [Ideonella benzenivorans]MCA6215480.1 LysR family transcriptional regulator ArgP [Ideonella benzenivorans]